LKYLGISKDYERAPLTFAEPKPSFLQRYDPNKVLRDLRDKRLNKQKNLVLLQSDLVESHYKATFDSSHTNGVASNQKRPSILQKSKSSATFRLKAKGTGGVSSESFQQPFVYPEKKPEGNLIINDTLALGEARNGSPSSGQRDTDPFEKKINLKMHKGFNNKTTVSFYCKELQEEHRRLGMNPDEVLNTEGYHPFYRFIPHHAHHDSSYETSVKMRREVTTVTISLLGKLHQGKHSD
jgi:hypothetical protein